jgi:ABC-type uncharacterized transport system permease subunit
MSLFEFSFWGAILASTLRLSTPLIFASLGGYFSENSGVINIGLEGLMLTGAFAAAVGNYSTGSPMIGLLCGIAAATLLALVHAFCCITLKSDQVVTGMAINILTLGMAPFLSNAIYGTTGSTPPIDLANHIQEWHIPLISNIPLIGDIIGTHIPFVYAAILCVFAVHYWSLKRPNGLHLRAAGEHPEAADSLGINVIKVRYFGVLMSGVMCGLAGACLSIGNASSFSRGMTSGRGYIALTALIFGKWKPIPTFIACLLFGFTDALQIRMQGVSIPPFGEIAPQFVQMIPYVVTIVVLAGFVGKSQAPKALGTPYSKE